MDTSKTTNNLQKTNSAEKTSQQRQNVARLMEASKQSNTM